MDTLFKQIQRIQLLLLKYDIHLFPQGFENSQAKIQELFQIIQEDKQFNEDLNKEVNLFLATHPQHIRQILDYDSNLKIQKDFVTKQQESKKVEETINETQNRIYEMQKEYPILQAFIRSHLIRDQDRIFLLEEVFAHLSQLRAQAIQEIHNLDKRSISEVKAFSNPPQAVLRITEIIVILLNNSQNNTWNQFKRLVVNPNEFLNRLLEFQIVEISLSQLTNARNIFESLNQQQCQRCSLCAYSLYKWTQYQLQIAQIFNNQYQGITQLENHKKAEKFQEKIQEFSNQIAELEQRNFNNQDHQKPIKSEQEEKAKQIIQTIKQFDELQIIVKPKRFGLKITNFIIKFLKQQKCSENQINFLVNEIITSEFADYSILHHETPLLPYDYPIILNKGLIQNKSFESLIQNTLVLIQNPFQLHYNLKQLNNLISQGDMTEEIKILVYQVYYNYQSYSDELMDKIFRLVRQSIEILNDSVQFPLHKILELKHEKQTERRIVFGFINFIESHNNMNIFNLQQLKYQGKPVIDYLINSYFEENQNKSKLTLQDNQIIEIKNIIVKEKLDIDETMEKILEKQNVIQQCKDYYNEVHKKIEEIKQTMVDRKAQQERLGQQTQQYQRFHDAIKNPLNNILTVKKLLEDQQAILKDKDNFIKQQIENLYKISNQPIHKGIKINELEFFKHLYQFNPLCHFASKLTLKQIGIYQFTPDIARKFLGSYSSQKRLKSLTVNNLNENQQNKIENLLTDFKQIDNYSHCQIKAVQQLIKRPYRILYLKNQKALYQQLLALRTDLLQKQRVIKNNLNMITQLKFNIEQQVLFKIEEEIKQIKMETESLQLSHEQFQSHTAQLNEMISLQCFIAEFQSFDSTDLGILLFGLNFNQIQQQGDQKKLHSLAQILYQKTKNHQNQNQNSCSKLNLLLMYLQQQYINKQGDFKKIYDKIGLFKIIEIQTILEALSYWKYINTDPKTNINHLIGALSYQLFYKDFGYVVQAICLQSEIDINSLQQTLNYQIIVLYEILHKKYGRFTLCLILQFLKQVISIQQKISNIYEILNHEIHLGKEKQIEIEFNQFKQEVQTILNIQVKEFLE